MHRFSRPAVVLAALVAVAPPLAAKDAKPRTPPPQYGSVDAQGIYKLSPDELAFDCKKLLSAMQIRILQVRSYDPSRRTSDLSRQVQSAADPVLGVMFGKTSKYDRDDANRHRTDRAMLEAYNQRAAALGCKVYDLQAELAPGKTMRDMPVARAQQPAPAAVKK